ncbi:MAG: hypothetical protein SFT91_03115 [Rickettsiaceae bacterium]|nr:hypothetical protein [Rickettsiaceae bacterium]
MRAHFFCFLLLFFGASCTKDIWISDTKSQTQSNEDLLSCTNSSNISHPPLLITKSEHSLRPVNSATSTGRADSNKVSYSPNYSPVEKTQTVDANFGPREESIEKCMKGKNWKIARPKK